jgi:SAM-dependent methyltransferase
MHPTSFLKIEAFYKTRVEPLAKERRVRVLDIGSKVYAGQRSYKEVFTHPAVEYTGLDLEDGENVDFVPKLVYLWQELENESFDFCISGSTFEHNPFMWITMAEIARVLHQDGLAMIVAPGRGMVHGYPVDCWRFFPESWSALCAYTGLKLVESFFEDYRFDRVENGSEWCDSCLIARKPSFIEPEAADSFYSALARIAATMPTDLALRPNPGEPDSLTMRHYEESAKMSWVTALGRRLRPRRVLTQIFRQF